MTWLLRGSICAFWLAYAYPCDPLRAAEYADPVTSDSADYCAQLRLLVEAMTRQAVPPPRADVQLLSEEGRLMCENGLVRGGITRLRRALVILRQGQANPDLRD